jgi:hypothetical protein
MTTEITKTSTLIASDKGGVGKSMISLLQTMIYDNAGYPLRLVEIDNQRKLSSILGERVDLSLDAYANIADVSRNRHLAESFYNPVYLEMAKADSLIDFGANVTTPFLEWFKNCEMDVFAAQDGIGFRFVACAIPDDQAIASALSAIEVARRSLGPDAQYFVVLNDIFGESGFTPYAANPEYSRLVELEAEGLLSIIRIDYCASKLLEYGKVMHLTPKEIIERAEEVAKTAGLDEVAVRVHRLKLMRWLQAAQTAMDPLLKVYD